MQQSADLKERDQRVNKGRWVDDISWKNRGLWSGIRLEVGNDR